MSAVERVDLQRLITRRGFPVLLWAVSLQKQTFTGVSFDAELSVHQIVLWTHIYIAIVTVGNGVKRRLKSGALCLLEWSEADLMLPHAISRQG